MTPLTQSVLLGGHVHVCLEDSLFPEPGVLASNNAAMVEKATRIITMLGERIAAPAEAREIIRGATA